MQVISMEHFLIIFGIICFTIFAAFSLYQCIFVLRDKELYGELIPKLFFSFIFFVITVLLVCGAIVLYNKEKILTYATSNM